MQAEVISIGDELTSGLSLDTNAQWLSLRLQELGIRVIGHATVGDELQAIVDTFRAAIGRADVVLVSGGLGPTADDLTREALAATIERPLVCDEASLEHIRCLFARRGRTMPEQNKIQALFPDGSRVVPNPHGTAPGIALEVPRDSRGPARVYCLPGVPAEMREMWSQTVETELRQLGPAKRVIRQRRIKCFGAGESAIEAMLPELTRRGRHPRVGITASQATISLIVTAHGTSEDDCRRAMEPTLRTIRESLGELIFGEGDDQLQHAVVRLLRNHGKTLATAEWATGGAIVERLGSVVGSEHTIRGGVVAADAPAFSGLLGLPVESLSAASPNIPAETMAQAVRRGTGADYGLAVGPFPKHDPDDTRPKSVAVALATPDGVKRQELSVAIHPALRIVFCAKAALNFTRLELLRSPH